MAQELFLVSAEWVVPFPDDRSWDLGTIIEPVVVAAHATGRVAALKGKNVVVSEAGPMGKLVA